MNEKILAHLKFRSYKNSDELCEQIAAKNKTVMLSFSGGKDSIVSWLKMKRYFDEIIPVFFYRIPNLKFVDEKIDYYQDFFKTKIIRLPHPSLVKQLNHGLFQTRENIKAVFKLNWPNATYDNFFDEVKRNKGLSLDTFTGIGNRATDNLQRWTAFVTNGPVNDNRKVFWPVFDYSLDDLESELKKAKVKLPVDYQLFGKTFDSLQYRYIVEIRNKFPDDFETIKHWFPLIELELLRYENQ